MTCAMTGLALLLLSGAAAAETETFETRSFRYSGSVALAATPAEVWEAVTGDIGGWWDHKFSEGEAAAFFIDPSPGGGFWEYFDEDGIAGVRHAEVIFSDGRGRLVFEGPLGFSGHAVDIVTTWEIVDAGEGKSRLDFAVSFSGAWKEGWQEALIGVEDHFMGRLQGYLAAGCRGGGRCEAFP